MSIVLNGLSWMQLWKRYICMKHDIPCWKCINKPRALHCGSSMVFITLLFSLSFSHSHVPWLIFNLYFIKYNIKHAWNYYDVKCKMVLSRGRATHNIHTRYTLRSMFALYASFFIWCTWVCGYMLNMGNERVLRHIIKHKRVSFSR